MRESPSLLRSAFAMLLLFVLFAMTTCTALAQPVAAPRPFGVWATGGGGTLRGGDANAWGDVVGLHVQHGPMVVSVRRHLGRAEPDAHRGAQPGGRTIEPVTRPARRRNLRRHLARKSAGGAHGGKVALSGAIRNVIPHEQSECRDLLSFSRGSLPGP